jgi:hypothetical protein
MCYGLKEVADLWDETMEPVFPKEHIAFLGRGGFRVCQALEKLKRLRLFVRVVTFRDSLLVSEGCDAERLEHRLGLSSSCNTSTYGR